MKISVDDQVIWDSEKNSKPILRCSFCGKKQNEVQKLIAGPGVYICDECIELCNEIIDEELNEKNRIQEPTICTNCKNRILNRPDDAPCFYLCGKGNGTDFVSGENKKIYCSEKNKGNCSDYETIQIV